ncbi:MAG: ABC transporter substrate-binding protein [Desulfuromonadales bacterium]
MPSSALQQWHPPPFLFEAALMTQRLLPFFLVFLLWASPAVSATWTDAVGRTVQVPDHPQRLVSLVPSLTEILFALNLGDRLVGATQFCTYPPAAAQVPRVGNYMQPSLEAIVASKPDLVFASADMAAPALVAQLDKIGIATFVVAPRDLDSTIATIRTIGSVLEETATADRLARGMEEAFCRIRAATENRPRPRVLLAIMVNPLTVAGPNTLGHHLIETARGINVVPNGPGRYPTWSMEAVLAADPDVIIVSPNPGEANPAAHFAAWPQLRAVRENRVITIPDPDWVYRPGPRLILGLEAIARALHGSELRLEDASCAP